MSRSRPARRRRFACVESLENRICLSVQSVLSEGLLSILGTREGEAVEVVDNGQGRVIVLARGGREAFDDVRQIKVDMLAGDDTVLYRRELGRSPVIPIEVDLGAGDDALRARGGLFDAEVLRQQLALTALAGDGNDQVHVNLAALPIPGLPAGAPAAKLAVDLGLDNDEFSLNTANLPEVELDLRAGAGDDNALIGLLLPAVQKVREAAARMSVGLGEGNDSLRVNTSGIDQVDLDVAAGEGDDNALIGLLLPAVQKVREAAARMNLDLGAGHDRFGVNTTGIDLPELDVTGGDGDDNGLIGLLLPAVQKVREAAARAQVDLGEGNDSLQINTHGFDRSGLGVVAGEGDDNVLIGLLLPAVQKVREAAARLNVDLGGGADRLRVNAIGIDLVDAAFDAGGGDDNVLIGLLLPAVQKVREAAARMKVSLGEGNDRLALTGLGYPQVELDVDAGDGDDAVLLSLLRRNPPDDAPATATVHIDLGEGTDRLRHHIRGYDVVDLVITSLEDEPLPGRNIAGRLFRAPI